MRSLNFLLGRLGLQRAGRQSTADAGPRHLADGRTLEDAYPPVDPGIPARAIEAVIDAHQDIIDRIKVI